MQRRCCSLESISWCLTFRLWYPSTDQLNFTVLCTQASYNTPLNKQRRDRHSHFPVALARKAAIVCRTILIKAGAVLQLDTLNFNWAQERLLQPIRNCSEWRRCLVIAQYVKYNNYFIHPLRYFLLSPSNDPGKEKDCESSMMVCPAPERSWDLE